MDENAKSADQPNTAYGVYNWIPTSNTSTSTRTSGMVDWAYGTVNTNGIGVYRTYDQYQQLDSLPPVNYPTPADIAKQVDASEGFAKVKAAVLWEIEQRKKQNELKSETLGICDEGWLERFIGDLLNINTVLSRVSFDYACLSETTNSRSEKEKADKCVVEIKRSLDRINVMHAYLVEMLAKCDQKQTSKEPSKSPSGGTGAFL